jgi:hypothetical protein
VFEADRHPLHDIPYEVFHVVVDGILEFTTLVLLFLFQFGAKRAVLRLYLFNPSDEVLVDLAEFL